MFVQCTAIIHLFRFGPTTQIHHLINFLFTVHGCGHYYCFVSSPFAEKERNWIEARRMFVNRLGPIAEKQRKERRREREILQSNYFINNNYWTVSEPNRSRQQLPFYKFNHSVNGFWWTTYFASIPIQIYDLRKGFGFHFSHSTDSRQLMRNDCKI